MQRNPSLNHSALQYPSFTLLLTVISLAVSGCFSPVGPVATLPTSTPAGFEISGRVWLDADGDGQQDAGEAGLTGAPVRLYQGEHLLAESVSGADGRFTFPAIPPGEYQLRFSAPAGFRFSPQDSGDDASDSDAGPDGELSIAIPGGQADLGAGLVPPGPGTPLFTTIPAPPTSN